jgi:hypothetical protein
MTVPKQLALIALGYVIAIVGGFAAVAVNEFLMPADISQGSPGMVAFGDMVLLVLVTGFLGLLPTFFLIRLAIAKAPRASLVALTVVALAGPLSWLAMVALAHRGPGPYVPAFGGQSFGWLIAFAAIPRIVVGPILVVAEGLAMILVRQRNMRIVLAATMLMDLIPIGIYASRMASAMLR